MLLFNRCLPRLGLVQLSQDAPCELGILGILGIPGSELSGHGSHGLTRDLYGVVAQLEEGVRKDVKHIQHGAVATSESFECISDELLPSRLLLSKVMPCRVHQDQNARQSAAIFLDRLDEICFQICFQ